MSLSDHGIPIIRFEIEGIKRSMIIALTEHSAKMDADIISAVEEYCTPENIHSVISAYANSALDFAIKTEVDNFFRFGDGRKAVAEAVKKAILTNGTYTPLDEVWNI